MEQMTLELDMGESPVPGSCAHEASTVGSGRKAKSFCERMNAWTNCREWDECLFERWERERGR